jgi:RimJ/RimL family protein N-acetyltransferase
MALKGLITANEALGFRLEGIFHDEALIDGSYRDVLSMAIWDTDAISQAWR